MDEIAAIQQTGEEATSTAAAVLPLTSPQIPAQPLEKIALSCSGGGYRAASFHLGAMSYLNRLEYKGAPLLEKVKMISTVSGGTITGAVYALQKQQKKSFPEIYDFMMSKLSKLDLIKMGIEKLNPDGQWNSSHKRKNLINAFSELYDQHFTEGATLAAFDEMKDHLEAVSFNSTEFNNSINFRFRNKGTGLHGNKFNTVPQDLAREIKVADAIAASSCFPGGFEPIMWPMDFAHNDAPKLREKKAGLKPAGLMDGGIYDNQGIDSILLYKKKEKNYFDLVIISDVTSPYMKPFKPAEDQPKTGWRNMTVKEFGQKIKRVNRWINWSLFGVMALWALLPLTNGYTNNWFTGLCIGLALGTMILWIAKLLAGRYVKRSIPALMTKFEAWIKKKNLDFYYNRLSLLHIEKLSVRRVEPLILDRLNSILTLLLDVFLKVVRRLNYAKVYEDETWQYRRMSNLIRELTEEDFTDPAKKPTGPVETADPAIQTNAPSGGTFKGPYDKVIGKEIKKVAEEASSFGTTLWFTENEQLANMLGKLIATGQFTMCYNMIEYLEKLMFTPGNGFDNLDAATKEQLGKLYTQCLADWKLFYDTPLFLLNKMEEDRKK